VRHLRVNKASKALYIRFNTNAAGILSSSIIILLREGQVHTFFYYKLTVQGQYIRYRYHTVGG
jgi:hypothetical protein